MVDYRQMRIKRVLSPPDFFGASPEDCGGAAEAAAGFFGGIVKAQMLGEPIGPLRLACPSLCGGFRLKVIRTGASYWDLSSLHRDASVLLICRVFATCKRCICKIKRELWESISTKRFIFLDFLSWHLWLFLFLLHSANDHDRLMFSFKDLAPTVKQLIWFHAVHHLLLRHMRITLFRCWSRCLSQFHTLVGFCCFFLKQADENL